MKYTFIGDIHGKVEEVERALALDGKKVFVGDFMDSFERGDGEHEQCIELVCAAIERGDTEAIFGNHELSYLIPQIHRCSGYSKGRHGIVAKHGDKIAALFKPHLLLDKDLLITHAGVTRQLWDECQLKLETLDKQLYNLWQDHRSPVHYISYKRGGRNPYGGTFWNDWREFRPVPELRQVFGHTGGSPIRTTPDGRNHCIDCLDVERKFLEAYLPD